MPKYCIEVPATLVYYIEADDKEEALEMSDEISEWDSNDIIPDWDKLVIYESKKTEYKHRHITIGSC